MRKLLRFFAEYIISSENIVKKKFLNTSQAVGTVQRALKSPEKGYTVNFIFLNTSEAVGKLLSFFSR